MVSAPVVRDRQDQASQVGVLTLFGLPNTGYHLKKAITVQVERDEGGSFVISEANTGAFHYDPDLSQALAGFVRAFVEEFEFLVQHEGSLSSALASD
jgi:hypothetical protein